jgi:ABC-type oligopeptide transport system substrate-binding subunit
VLYAFNEPTSARLAQIVRSNLKAIGIDVEIKLFTRRALIERLSTENEPYDMAMTRWLVDYDDPEDFLALLDGRALDEHSYLSGAFLNAVRFDDP